MTVPIVDPPLRPPLPRHGGERETLVSFLEYFRSVLLRKVVGLTTEQAQRQLAPSELHLHGLVRHMAIVEQYWFCNLLLGTDEASHYEDPTDEDRDFHPQTTDDLSTDLRVLVAQQDRCRAIEREADSLDQLAVKQRENEPVTLRWIMIHMIEEYARHCGHADFLRQAIDGRTGDD